MRFPFSISLSPPSRTPWRHGASSGRNASRPDAHHVGVPSTMSTASIGTYSSVEITCAKLVSCLARGLRSDDDRYASRRRDRDLGALPREPIEDST